MQAEKAGSVFDLLAKPVRKALAEIGFAEPTLPQTMAFKPILEGKKVLLIAPTGTGKTELVLLPFFSRVVELKKKVQSPPTGFPSVSR
jgi:ATP-dependent helicase Lhr and Lhr-like helicase